MNTNRFRPGNIPGMEEYGNYNINFQAIFSYIAGEIVFAGSLGIDHPRVTKLRIRCPECVMGVNEENLDLQSSETLESALASDALSKRSKFMWISKEDVNSLMRRADIGIEFKDKTHHDEDDEKDPMIFPPLSPGDLDFYHPDLILFAIIEDLLGQHSIVSSDHWNWIYEESKDLLPVSMVPHIDIVRFFYLLAYFFLMKTIYVRSNYWKGMRGKQLQEMILVERMKMLQLFPIEWFQKLISLFLFDDIYLSIRDTYKGVSPPKGTPPDNHEKAVCIKKIFSYTISHRMEIESLIKISTQVLSLHLEVSSVSCFHSQLISLLKRLLSCHDTTSSNPGLRVCGLLRDRESKMGGYSNLLDLRKILPHTISGHPMSSEHLDECNVTELIPSYLEVYRPVQLNADWLCKEIGSRRTVPSGLPLLPPPKIKYRAVLQLPVAARFITFRLNMSEGDNSIHIPITK